MRATSNHLDNSIPIKQTARGFCSSPGHHRTTSIALFDNQDKFQYKCMDTLFAAERSEISVLDYAIQRLDQKDFRVRLSSALDEVDLDSHTCKALKCVLLRRGLL